MKIEYHNALKGDCSSFLRFRTSFPIAPQARGSYHRAMLFAQIIAFILVLVVYEAHHTEMPRLDLTEAVLEALLFFCMIWVGISLWVRMFLRRLYGLRPPLDPGRAARRLVALAHGLGVLGLALMFTTSELKAHIMQVPWIAASQTLSGGFAVLLFFAVMIMVWYLVYPVERQVLNQSLPRLGYVKAQARFVAPVAFPWLLVSLCQDALMVGWPDAAAWLRTQTGDLIFLIFFLLVLSLLFPPLVRHWWGCHSWPDDEVRRIAQEMLRRSRVKVTAILSWPIMEGRMISAGVLGVFPGFRYLLITPALAESMNPEELGGVFAHEAGHVHHRHMALYLLFFLGFFAATYALSSVFSLILMGLFYLLSYSDWGLDLIVSPKDNELFSLVLALPMVLLLALYLRFIMGWFMRHFERQADLFAIGINGSAAPLASALETVARLSGNIRNLPSWHHFSVAQRVDALWRAQEDPGLIRAESRLIKKGFALYLICLLLITGLGFGLNSADYEAGLERTLTMRLLERQARSDPHNAALFMNLGVLRLESGDEQEGLDDLGAAVLLAPKDPEVINTLAWFLVTAKDQSLRRPKQALILAQKAVAISPKPHIWDTLAEAFWANGHYERAVAAARTALSSNPKDKLDYYQKQLRRFQIAAKKNKQP